MFKRIYTSQRADLVSGYNETRDALDQKWSDFLLQTGGLLFPMPNNPEAVEKILENSPPDGILLSGGNSPVAYGGASPERDLIDELLLNFAIEHEIPLIGVCRGLQSIILHFEGSLKPIENHVKVDHPVNGKINRTVNSYHTLAAESISSELLVLAACCDGAIESICHKALPILGIMWHPERTDPYSLEDIDLFKNFWYKGRI